MQWGAQQQDFVMSEMKFEKDSSSPCVRLFIELLRRGVGDVTQSESRTLFHLDESVAVSDAVFVTERAPAFESKPGGLRR